MRKPVTVQQVMDPPVISDPLRRLDCCVITDGGGAIVLTTPEIARSLKRPLVKVIGCGETIATNRGGYLDLTQTGAEGSGAAAFAEAGIKPGDINYA